MALRSFEELSSVLLQEVNVEPPRGGIYWIIATREAKRQREEAIRLARRPKDLPEDELVSEQEYKPRVSGNEARGNDDDISVFS